MQIFIFILTLVFNVLAMVSFNYFDFDVIFLLLFLMGLFQIESLSNIFNKSLTNFLNLKKIIIDKYNDKKLNVFIIYMLLLSLIFILPSFYYVTIDNQQHLLFHSYIEIFNLFYTDFIKNIIYIFNPQTYIDIINSRIMFAGLNYIWTMIVIMFIVIKSIIVLFLFFYLFKNIKSLFKI